MALPDGYKQLAYIQSTGTQYIALSKSPNVIGRLVIDFIPMKSGTRQIPVGSWSSSSGVNYILQHNTSNALDITVTGVTKSNVSGKILTIGARYVYDYNPNGNEITLNGEKYCNTSGYASTTRALYLFASNDSSDGAYCKSSTKVYSLKIYDKSGNLTEDYVPAMRISDSVVGLYDVVQNTFKTNSGTGTFSYGALYDVSIETDPANSGVVTGGGLIPDGGATTIEAIANSGFEFNHFHISEPTHQFLTNYVYDDSNLMVYGATRNWTQVTFTTPAIITRYSGNNATDGSARSWDMTIKGSNDGTTFTDIQTNAMNATGTMDITVSNTTPYKYYRWYFSRYNNTWDTGRYIFSNFKIYGYRDYDTTDNPYTFGVECDTDVTAYFDMANNCRFKVNGEWKYGTMYKKANGEWVTGSVYTKVNGAWETYSNQSVQTLNRALSLLMGNEMSTEDPNVALNIIMKGE